MNNVVAKYRVSQTSLTYSLSHKRYEKVFKNFQILWRCYTCLNFVFHSYVLEQRPIDTTKDMGTKMSEVLAFPVQQKGQFVSWYHKTGSLDKVTETIARKTVRALLPPIQFHIGTDFSRPKIAGKSSAAWQT